MYLFCFVSPLVLRAPSKLCHMVGIWLNFIIPLQKLGGRPKIWDGEISDNFRLWSRISPERLKISKIGNQYELWQFFLRFTKKSRELWSTNGLELHVSLDPLKMHFLAYYISAVSWCCAMKFLHALDIGQALLAHTPSGAGVPKKIFIVKIKNRPKI